jgi:hypothetical protein
MTICGLALMCPLASGQTGAFPAPPSLTSPWKFTLEPYLWLPAMKGDVTVRNRTADVDLNVYDALNLIFDAFKFGAMGRFEAQKGNLLFTLDVDYVDLEDEQTTARGLESAITSQTLLTEFGAGYRLGTWPLSPDVRPSFSVDFLTGGRYVRLESGIKIREGGPRGRINVEVDDTVEWLEPFVGGRVLLALSRQASFVVRGDVGGFGVGSELTWNVVGNFLYQVSRTVYLSVGYRALDMDYEQGSGISRFKFDMRLHGPVLGAVFRF